MTLSITPGRSVDVDEVIDGLAPRDPAVEAEFLAAFYRFHREKTGEREATTRESLNKILSRSGKDFDVYGLYRGCCQRGGFHSREHAKRHMSFAEVYREMNNYDVVNTYTDIGKRLLDAYEKYLLAYEGEHPDDINADKCDVCEREDGAMIQCDHCETWTHEQCHRPRALQRQPIQYPEANAENTAGAGNTNTAGGADDRADSDSDQMNDLAAIAKAKEILASGDVSGAAETHLPTLVQTAATSLAQLRASKGQEPNVRRALESFLRNEGMRLKSQSISMLAQKVASYAANGGPFDKVKKMIKDLISKLMEESTAETEHKGWCDAELGQNKITREAKSEEVEKLRAEVEDLQSTIAQLGQEITDLAAAVAELDAATAKASEDRTATKAKNEQTIAEAKEAQMAIERAVVVLKDYYAKAAEATALTQQSPGDDAPETFGSEPYKGMLPEGGNVVDFLEVILSDFARLESDTSGAEASEIEMYKKYMNESEQDKALKLNEKGHKESTRTDKESALHSSESELRATQDQLDKAAEYYEKLKPTCVDSGISFEERVKRREEEIQSLQEALKILAGTDLA